jgi:hypothetical protein
MDAIGKIAGPEVQQYCKTRFVDIHRLNKISGISPFKDSIGIVNELRPQEMTI